MPDPVFEPDPATAPDPSKVKVLRGSPPGIRNAQVHYRAAGGILGRKTVPRSRAQSALLKYHDKDGYDQEQVMTLSEAEHFLREARKRAEAETAEEAARHAAVDLVCPHCKVRRQYAGAMSFMLGEMALMGGVKALSQDAVVQHAYRCPVCGSTEFFADGFLRHPIR